MRKFVLVSIALATALGSFATPSLAQKSSRGGNDNGSGGRGDYYSILKNDPITHLRRHKVVLVKGGAYCSTNWAVLFDESGHRTKVRHCDERRSIDIN